LCPEKNEYLVEGGKERRGEGKEGGGGGKVNANDVKGIISACHHDTCLVYPVRICQFAAASTTGSVSSGSVRASVTRDLQHGGTQEKQEAQRCKRRIWARAAACGNANLRRDRRENVLASLYAIARDASIRTTCQRR